MLIEEFFIHQLHGNLIGLKKSQINGLERLYRRRVPVEEVISDELAWRMTELSEETGRQVGVLIGRSGAVEYVIVGDERSLLIPELSDFPLGRKLLRGLRLVHTHLRGEAVTGDDLTDLSLLRFDLVAALLPSLHGQRLDIQIAHLVPPYPRTTQPYVIERHQSLSAFTLDFGAFISTLEASLKESRQESREVDSTAERGILISVTTQSPGEAEDSLDELQELARTAGVSILDRVIQRQKAINPRYLMGEGKIREVVIRALQLGATLLVFDQELSPTQVRSISQMTELKVIDRSQLILDIFARRAKSLDGKVQVELAQLKYLLPRLSGRGVQMSRLMGGIGGRGPGETKLEIDRRRIRDRISRLERELEELSKGRRERRRKRVKAGVPIVSIVGYTNAGKSTLLNSLTKSDVFTENLLFATLDTSTRRLRFPREREVIITDTVGFIRSLPKSLMGAFKATLEELQDSDLLIHVVDAANPRFEEQINQVDTILEELELGDKPRLLVYNKSDLVTALRKKDPVSFIRVRQSGRRYKAISVSALDRTSLDPLLVELEKLFWAGEQDPWNIPPEEFPADEVE
jgi:GTP-binding protein HflX